MSFIRSNQLPTKPRKTGLTEIRGPYYTPMGPHYLQDVLNSMGHAGLAFHRSSPRRLVPIACMQRLYVYSKSHLTATSSKIAAFRQILLLQECEPDVQWMA